MHQRNSQPQAVQTLLRHSRLTLGLELGCVHGDQGHAVGVARQHSLQIDQQIVAIGRRSTPESQ